MEPLTCGWLCRFLSAVPEPGGLGRGEQGPEGGVQGVGVHGGAAVHGRRALRCRLLNWPLSERSKPERNE